MASPNLPTIRFLVELKSEKLIKSIDKKTETLLETVEALPEQQLVYWEKTREWVDALLDGDTATYAVRAGVLIVLLYLPDMETLHTLRGMLNGFKPFQITPYTRASKFTLYPEGLDGVGYGPGMSGGSLKKYFEKEAGKGIAKKVASRYLVATSIQTYRSL